MVKKYSEKDIQVLSEIEHVHKRSAVYLGNTRETIYDVPVFGDKFKIEAMTFVPAVMKLFSEVVDNSNDELIQSKPRKPTIVIDADVEASTFSVEDNGRGVPIGKHETGKYTPEVVFTTLRSGRNFTDEKDAGVIGTNGMGVSLSAMCSEEFTIEIHRDNKRYVQVFSDATRSIKKPKITKKASKKTGTKVTFRLKEDIFSDIVLPSDLVRNRAVELAVTNPGLTVTYNTEKFMYKKGFAELMKKYFDNSHRFANLPKDDDDAIEFYVVIGTHNDAEEKMFSWVNSSLLYDGGICNTQFSNAFFDRVTTHLEREAKKKKITLNKNDIRQGLMFFGNLKFKEPLYDSQAKTKLTAPSIRKDYDAIIDASWTKFARANKEWLQSIIERAMNRSNINATKDLQKTQQKGKRIKVDGFMEATGRRRSECQLLVTEGNSAKANIVQSRDPKTTAALPLSGKINNVHGASVAQLLGMGKITELLNVIGLIPGRRAMRSELRYGRVCFATDADYDGDHITTLLVKLFYQFWPELFDPKYPPFFFRMVAPNIVAEKKGTRVHFPNRDAYDKVKNKYKGYEISYLKGLGTMTKKDWNMILKGDTDVFYPIIDDGKFEDKLNLFFSDDSDARKEWLSDVE